jgi:dihydrofolate reductase
MRISAIVATDPGRVIGVGTSMPWHIPDDLKKFKALTMGKPVIMGRKTHEAIGRVLPGRPNIVLSTGYGEGLLVSNSDFGLIESNSLIAVLEYFETRRYEEVFIIGGEEVFDLAKDIISRIYMSVVRVPVKLSGKEPVAKWPIECPGPLWSLIEHDQSHKDFVSLVFERRIDHVTS